MWDCFFINTKQPYRYFHVSVHITVAKNFNSYETLYINVLCILGVFYLQLAWLIILFNNLLLFWSSNKLFIFHRDNNPYLMCKFLDRLININFGIWRIQSNTWVPSIVVEFQANAKQSIMHYIMCYLFSSRQQKFQLKLMEYGKQISSFRIFVLH